MRICLAIVVKRGVAAAADMSLCLLLLQLLLVAILYDLVVAAGTLPAAAFDRLLWDRCRPDQMQQQQQQVSATWQSEGVNTIYTSASIEQLLYKSLKVSLRCSRITG